MNAELVRANTLYKQSQDPVGVSSPMRRKFLEEALLIYRTNIRQTSQKERPSLLRNIGVASLRLAEVIDHKFELKMIFYHLAEAVSNLTLAWTMRPKEGDADWHDKVEEYVSDCYERAFRSLDGDVEADRLPCFHLLEKIEKAIMEEEFLDPFRVRFYLARGQYFYRCGIIALEVNNFKITDRLLEYLRQEVIMAEKFGKDCAETLVEIERLGEDSSFLRNSCDSIRLRAQGDELLTTYLIDAEETNFEMMWEILDMYKLAEMNCREQDLENEAIAVSRQARLYDKVFKIKPKAKKYYREAFDLAQCLFPKDLSKCAWFQECKNAIERYQQETLFDEQKKYEKEREPFLKKMTNELNALREVANLSDAYKLLKHVYTAHPPKVTLGDFVYKESEVTSSNIKKCLMKAITQYHPDKQVKFGMEWKVLCEEITKNLTARYECFK